MIERRKMQKGSQLGNGGQGGAGRDRGRGGRGRRKDNDRGPGGYCVCPQCSEKKAHEMGQPCLDQKCPECGVPMIRE
jgi:hypothetical protein